MTNIIKAEQGKLFDYDRLPAESKKKIDQLAVIDIYKDQAKKEIKAGQVKINSLIDQWLKMKNSSHTKSTYEKALKDFFNFSNSIGINPLLIKAKHVDQYILSLKNTGLSNNSIRTKLMACSSFYTMLRRYEHVKLNPFYNCQLPKKQYKKSIQVDKNKTIPVMNKAEYEMILNTLISKSKLNGSYKNNRVKKSAMDLIPVIHFLRTYGLRVGSVPSIKINDCNFTYSTKGNKSSSVKLSLDTIRILRQYKRTGQQPFKDYKVITIQKAVEKITTELKQQDKIRYAYSSHDFRHFFAVDHYKKNKDVVALKRILNHSSINITDVYLQNIGVENSEIEI